MTCGPPATTRRSAERVSKVTKPKPRCSDEDADDGAPPSSFSFRRWPPFLSRGRYTSSTKPNFEKWSLTSCSVVSRGSLPTKIRGAAAAEAAAAAAAEAEVAADADDAGGGGGTAAAGEALALSRTAATSGEEEQDRLSPWSCDEAAWAWEDEWGGIPAAMRAAASEEDEELSCLLGAAAAVIRGSKLLLVLVLPPLAAPATPPAVATAAPPPLPLPP